MVTSKNTVTVEFQREKPTPNTVRYAEVVEEGGNKLVGVLYIQKSTADKLGQPEKLLVTIAPGA